MTIKVGESYETSNPFWKAKVLMELPFRGPNGERFVVHASSSVGSSHYLIDVAGRAIVDGQAPGDARDLICPIASVSVPVVKTGEGLIDIGADGSEVGRVRVELWSDGTLKAEVIKV